MSPRPRFVIIILGLLVGACGSQTAPLSAGSSTPPATQPDAVTTTVNAATTTAAVDTTMTVVQTGPLYQVDIGGRIMVMECRGQVSTPTVVVDAWSSNGVRALVEAVSDFARVCTYDHAGTRRSGPPPELPRTAQAYADDLHALLSGSGVEGPYILVPWSLTTWTTILYARTYPEDLAGVVMIDPRGPGVSSGDLAALPEPMPDEPLAVTDVRNFLLELISNPGENDDEGLDWHASEELARAAIDEDGPLFGDRPTIVLSATDTFEDWRTLDLPPEILDLFWQVWIDEQQRLAAESSRGEWRVVPDSRHAIQVDQLGAVVDAVREVVSAAG